MDGVTFMICPRCSTENSAYETRCVRCGSRFGGSVAQRGNFARNFGTQGGSVRPFVVPRETRYSSVIPSASTSGAPAADLQPGFVSQDSTARDLLRHSRIVDEGATARKSPAPELPKLEVVPPGAQPSLFTPSDFAGRPASLRLETADTSRGYVSAPKRKPARRRKKSDLLPFEQGTLDFLTPTSAPARQLQTSVEATVVCDHPVASPMHRLIATAWDAAVVFIFASLLCGAFAGALYLLGIKLPIESNVVRIGLAFALFPVGLAYYTACCLCGWDTPGMRAAHLKLVSLDGSVPTSWQRWKRLLAATVSLAAGGVGFLWALFDEERLGWHDQVSGTFPTPRMHVESSFRRR